MHQANEKAINDAMERFKQGRCPCCGKAIGESRGLEFRRKLSDLYCHTCRRRWPVELDVEALRNEFTLPEFVLLNEHPIPVLDLPISHEDSPRPAVIGKFSTFIQRVLLRR